MTDFARVQEHVRARIAATALQTDPFPFLEVRDLLPADYFAELQRSLPTPDQCRTVDEGRNFQFTPFNAKATEPNAFFWRSFAGHVSTAMMSAAIDKMAAPLESYLTQTRKRLLIGRGWNVARVRTFIEQRTSTEVFCRTAGYSSDPHFHKIDEIVSCLFYFPPDNEHHHLGTDLYRVTKPFRATWNELSKYSYVSRENVEIAHTTKFAPNTALLYINTPWAIHGNRMQEQDYHRWFSLIMLYAPVFGRLPQIADRLLKERNPFGLTITAQPGCDQPAPASGPRQAASS